LAFHGDVLAAPPGVFEKQATDGWPMVFNPSKSW
jgi:hypothetical protein